MTHVRIIRQSSGKFAVVTDFLGIPLTRLDVKAAGLLDIDPRDLDEPEAKRVAAIMDKWIDEQNNHARRKQKIASDTLCSGPDVLI